MSNASWAPEPMEAIRKLGERGVSAKATALWAFAVRAVDSLYYLSDMDRQLVPAEAVVNGHVADVIDVAHVRWATGTCKTALDLCAAGLGRAYGGHEEERELALSDFMTGKSKAALRSALTPSMLEWLNAIGADPEYKRITAARNALTHGLVTRHFTVPRQRLRLGIGDEQIQVDALVETAKSVAIRHVASLIGILSGR